MDFHHSNYRGWKLCTMWGRPCLGHGARETPPHDVIMAKSSTEAAVLAELHRQVDAFEDAATRAAGATERPRSPV